MKKILLIVFGFSFSLMYCQQNVLSSGQKVSSSTGVVNYSIGLVNYEEATGSGGSLASGIQSVSELLNTLSISSEDILKIKLFPNPTLDYLSIDLPNFNNISYRVVNILGKDILKGSLSSNKNRIDVRQLKTSTYFVILYSDNKKISTHQIIKQ